MIDEEETCVVGISANGDDMKKIFEVFMNFLFLLMKFLSGFVSN